MKMYCYFDIQVASTIATGKAVWLNVFYNQSYNLSVIICSEVCFFTCLVELYRVSFCCFRLREWEGWLDGMLERESFNEFGLLELKLLIFTWFFWASFRKEKIYLRKLEKAAMNALMQIPQSASAMLRTSRLLGVRSSLIFRKEIIVKPFRQKPSRAEIQNCLVWFNWKWKISTTILLLSLTREE